MSSSSVAATRCQQSAVAQILVPLREQGDLPPLFHMPAGYGDMRFFQQVADGIDNRPVYGLQPPGLKLVAAAKSRSAGSSASTSLRSNEFRKQARTTCPAIPAGAC